MIIPLQKLEYMTIEELQNELDTRISEDDQNYVRQDDISMMIHKIKNSREFINASPTAQTEKFTYSMIKEGD
jgi:hypothetical protein